MSEVKEIEGLLLEAFDKIIAEIQIQTKKGSKEYYDALRVATAESMLMAGAFASLIPEERKT